MNIQDSSSNFNSLHVLNIKEGENRGFLFELFRYFALDYISIFRIRLCNR